MGPMDSYRIAPIQGSAFRSQCEIPAKYLTELTAAGVSLTRCGDLQEFATVLTDDAVSISFSDVGCFYRFGTGGEDLSLVYFKSMIPPPDRFLSSSETISFLREWPETIVLSGRKASPFAEILINRRMESGIVLPLYDEIGDPREIRWVGMVLLNSKRPSFYHGSLFTVLQSLIALARGTVSVIHNTTREG